MRDNLGLMHGQVVFCDDDGKNIEQVITLGNGDNVVAAQICRTLGPAQGLKLGLTEEHMNKVLSMAGLLLLPMASAAPQCSANTGEALRLVMFDFDLTLTTEHLSRLISRKGLGIEQLSQEELVRIFGGTERLQTLRCFLGRLCQDGVKLGIMSRGTTSTIKGALCRVDILQYFDRIFGSDSADFENVQFQKVRLVRRIQANLNLSHDQVLYCDDDASSIEEEITLGNGDRVTAAQICRTLGPSQGLTNGLTGDLMHAALGGC
jgi:hypothetical protein